MRRKAHHGVIKNRPATAGNTVSSALASLPVCLVFAEFELLHCGRGNQCLIKGLDPLYHCAPAQGVFGLRSLLFR